MTDINNGTPDQCENSYQCEAVNQGKPTYSCETENRCEPNDHGRSTAKYEPIDHCGTNTQCVALFDHENMTDRSNSESVGGRFNRICLNSFHPTVL